MKYRNHGASVFLKMEPHTILIQKKKKSHKNTLKNLEPKILKMQKGNTLIKKIYN